MLEQIVIAICGLSSVYLSQDTRPSWQRFACIFGIIAQPFWMYATWEASQFGIFALSFVYAAGWARGVNNFWIKPRRKQ